MEAVRCSSHSSGAQRPPARPNARSGAPHAQRRIPVLPLHDGPTAPLPPWGAGTQLCARRRGLCYFAFVVTRWRGPHGRSEVRARRWRRWGGGGRGPGAPTALPRPAGTRCRTAAVGRPRPPNLPFFAPKRPQTWHFSHQNGSSFPPYGSGAALDPKRAFLAPNRAPLWLLWDKGTVMHR